MDTYLGESFSVLDGECCDTLAQLERASVKLVLADPARQVRERMQVGTEAYGRWTLKWMKACLRVLKPSGFLWIVADDDFAAEMVVLAKRGLHLRRQSWVVLHFENVAQQGRRFAESHRHLLCFTKSHKKNLRLPPSETWVYRRFKSCPWLLPALVERIVILSSKPGDTVLDPLARTWSSLAVPLRHGRHVVAIAVNPGHGRRIGRHLRKAVRELDAARAAAGQAGRCFTDHA